MTIQEIISSIKQGKKLDKTPVWVMRQAGRYLPDYRAVRSQMSFLELCRNPEMAATVSLQPIEIFDLDISIIFSDILLPLCDYSVDVVFPDTGGIKISLPKGEVTSFIDTGNIAATCQAIKTLRQKLNDTGYNNVPVFGFCGAPWTLATYILEGGSAKEFKKAKQLIYENPEKLKVLLDQLTDAMIDYLKQQIEAGADMIQVFDTWAGELTQDQFNTWVKPYLQRIYNSLPPEMVKSLYIKNISPYIEQVADLGLDILSVDWKVSLTSVWERLDSSENNTVKYLQGNLDPVILTANNKDAIAQEAKAILDEAAKLPCGHIFNLGHGITPDAKVENLKVLVETVKNYS